MASTSKFCEHSVVVLGKTGGGKSTVANQILGWDEFEVKTTFTSVTTEVKSATAKLPTTDDTTHHVKVIDTIGLFDTKRGEPGNKDALKAAKKFFLKQVPDGVNLILFVCKLGRWTAEEQKTFDFIKSKFADTIKDFSALVLTCCDGLSKEKREEIIRNFKTEETTAKVASFMGKGVFTVGFPPTKDMIPAIKEAYMLGIKEDQATLHKLICTSQKKYLSEEFVKKTFWEKLCPGIFL